MIFLRITFVFLIFLFQFAIAQKSKPLLKPLEVLSELNSTEDAISKMYVASEVLDVPSELVGNFIAEPDLSLVEIKAIQELARSKAKKREIIYIRYTNGDLRVVNALIQAKKAGVRVTVITDFNTVMSAKNSSQNIFSFEDAEFKTDSSGKLLEGAIAIKTLTDNGFVVGKDLLSQPLYLEKPNSRIPIMHIKGMITFTNRKMTTWIGTNNASRNQRYNRLLKIEDDVIGREFLSYLRDLEDVFKVGKPISATHERPPLKVIYKNGSHLKISFTQGRFNTNDAQVELLETAELKRFYSSQFAPAFNKLVDAIYNNLQKNSPDASGVFVVDDRFGGPEGWGAMIRLSGFPVILPFGKMLYGVKESVAKRIQGWVYQRYSVDPDTGEIRKEKNQDGPPDERHVWHDKTNMFILSNGDTYVFTGSFNASGNFKNAEVQLEIKTNENSWITRSIQHSIEDVIDKEKTIWMIDVYQATVRNSIGILTNHTDLEVPMDVTTDVLEGLKSQSPHLVQTALEKMAHIESHLDSKLTKEEILKRIQKFMNFYNWYLESNSSHSNRNLNEPFANWKLRRLLLVPTLISNSELTDNSKFFIMESVVWRPDLSSDQNKTNALVLDGLKKIGLFNIEVPSSRLKKSTIPKDAEIFDLNEIRRIMNTSLEFSCSSYFN